MHAAFQLPFYFPTGTEWLLIALSLLAVAGGSCLCAWLLRTVRFRIAAAAAAIPLVFLLFLFGASFEGQLYCSPTVDSFDYLTEIDAHIKDEDYEGEIYYDEKKNVMVLNGKEYKPKQADNPDYLRGVGRVGACAFETLSPYAGNSLFMIHEMTEMVVSPYILILYAVKAAACILFPLCIRKKRGHSKREPAEAE